MLGIILAGGVAIPGHDPLCALWYLLTHHCLENHSRTTVQLLQGQPRAPLALRLLQGFPHAQMHLQVNTRMDHHETLGKLALCA